MICSESNFNNGGTRLRSFRGKSIGKLPRDHSYDILTTNVADFCRLKNLSGAKLKNYGLIALAEEISRQLSSDCLLVISNHPCANHNEKNEKPDKEVSKCKVGG